jgi:hypothetical protein
MHEHNLWFIRRTKTNGEVFCPSEAKTLAYYNGRIQGEVDDATLCSAIMNVWLHPASQNQALRKSLLAH